MQKCANWDCDNETESFYNLSKGTLVNFCEECQKKLVKRFEKLVQSNFTAQEIEDLNDIYYFKGAFGYEKIK